VFGIGEKDVPILPSTGASGKEVYVNTVSQPMTLDRSLALF